MASRGINVKIATPKVIKGLETSLVKIKKDFAEQAKNEEKYKKTFADRKSTRLNSSH